MSHSHRKVHSQGNIPFSWEDTPGVSKSMPQHDSLIDPTRRSSISNFPNFDSFSGLMALKCEDIKIPPPPPCQNLQPPRRSISGKGIGRWQWQEDPFLAAYKECTKSSCNGKLDANENKKKNVRARKNYKFMFSCRNSCDVEDGSFVKLSNLPPIPRGRVKGS